MHLLLASLFSLAQVLSFPFPAALVQGPDGHSIAYVLNESGIRSIWFANAPQYAPRMLWSSGKDDGQEITSLSISKDEKYVVYVRGGAHDSNWVTHPCRIPITVLPSRRCSSSRFQPRAVRRKCSPAATFRQSRPTARPSRSCTIRIHRFGRFRSTAAKPRRACSSIAGKTAN